MTEEMQGLYEVLTGQYGQVFETIEMWACINAVGAKLSKDGNQWCFLWGENLQEGVAGFGDTIYEAAKSFFNEISTSKA